MTGEEYNRWANSHCVCIDVPNTLYGKFKAIAVSRGFNTVSAAVRVAMMEWIDDHRKS